MWLFSGRYIKLLLKYVAIATLLLFALQLLLKTHNNDGGGGEIVSHNETTPTDGRIEKVEDVESVNITIAVTICGNDNMRQGLNALKSALILSRQPLHFVIMTEPEFFTPITAQLQIFRRALNSSTTREFTHDIREIQFPDDDNNWRKLFKPCAAQRLFLPDIFRTIDSLLYIDTDVLFLSPVEQVYRFFGEMNSSQIAGVSYESQDFSSNWYHKHARHPYYGFYGVNSGVMLMNLTRMRQFNWTSRLEPILVKYRGNMTWGDQDIINIIFHDHPDKLFIFDCNWNFRSDHCVYSLTCKPATTSGIKIVHGNRGVFLKPNKLPPFRALFTAVEDFDLATQSSWNSLPDLIKSRIDAAQRRTNCDKISHHFWEAFLNTTNRKTKLAEQSTG